MFLKEPFLTVANALYPALVATALFSFLETCIIHAVFVDFMLFILKCILKTSVASAYKICVFQTLQKNFQAFILPSLLQLSGVMTSPGNKINWLSQLAVVIMWQNAKYKINATFHLCSLGACQNQNLP